jgi:fibronectin type 3 domain-containing protein
MKKISVVSIITTFVVCSFAIAQQPVKAVVGGGPRGIYVHCGNEIIPPPQSNQNAPGYRIERKKKTDKSWDRIADIMAPRSLTEFLGRLEEIMPLVPEQLASEEIPSKIIWETVEKWRRMDSLKTWGSVLPVRIALGASYLDTTAEKGVQYEYRVSKIDTLKNVTIMFTSQSISYPQTVQYPRLRAVERRSEGNEVRISWGMGAGRRPASVDVYRKDGMNSLFNHSRPIRIIQQRRDSAYFVVRDSSVSQKQMYSYYIVPKDFYGNTGNPSDTVFISSTQFASIRLPESIRARSLDTLGGVRLQWHLNEPGVVKNLKIYRSTTWDKGYTLIATVAPMDSEYIDQSVLPMITYYYYLTMTGPLGEESLPTVKVIGQYRSSDMPMPPVNLRGEAVKNGVRLQWEVRDTDVNGFYVYRSKGGTDPLGPITPLIPYKEKEKVSTYLDTSKTLVGSITYIYAVKTESRSHVLGDFSETVSVRPVIPTVPLTPMKFAASIDGKQVRLHWLDMKAIDGAIAGYYLFRRDGAGPGSKKAEFKKLVDSLLPSTQNYFVDQSVAEGKIYEYAVQSVDFFKGVSSLSTTERVEIRLELPLPPTGVRAEKTTDGVLLRWGAVVHPDVVSYKINRSQVGGKASVVGTVKSDKTEFLDRTVRTGELYFFTITTLWKNGRESNPSKEISIRP